MIKKDLKTKLNKLLFNYTNEIKLKEAQKIINRINSTLLKQGKNPIIINNNYINIEKLTYVDQLNHIEIDQLNYVNNLNVNIENQSESPKPNFFLDSLIIYLNKVKKFQGLYSSMKEISASPLIKELANEEYESWVLLLEKFNIEDFKNHFPLITGKERTINIKDDRKKENYFYKQEMLNFYKDLSAIEIREKLDLLIPEKQNAFHNYNLNQHILDNKYDPNFTILKTKKYVNLSLYEGHTLKVLHTGEQYHNLGSAQYLVEMSKFYDQSGFEFDFDLNVYRIDLTIDLKDEVDYIQHFVHAYLINRIHVPIFKKDKVNFVTGKSLVHQISLPDLDYLRTANLIVDPAEVYDAGILSSLDQISALYIGNIKNQYHYTSLCIYNKGKQGGESHKKTRFELRFKSKKAKAIFYEILEAISLNNYDVDSVNSILSDIFIREFKSTISVKQYPKKYNLKDPKEINRFVGQTFEAPRLRQIKKEAPWFIDLIEQFKV